MSPSKSKANQPKVSKIPPPGASLPVTIECGVEEYRLKAGDITGDAAEYGDPATLQVGDLLYVALVYETDAGKRISLLPCWVVVGRPQDCSFSQYDETADSSDADEDADDAEEYETDDSEDEDDSDSDDDSGDAEEDETDDSEDEDEEDE